MSGKFRIDSLIENSLLIADTSDTAIEIDDASVSLLSFLDVRITHEQLLRFFLLDEVFQEDVFAKIVHYRRKFNEVLITPELVSKQPALSEDEELLTVEKFDYFHLRRRLPQENILFSDSIVTPKVKTKNELLFTSDRVSKRLPDITARHATKDEKSDFDFIVEFFDEQIDFILIRNRPQFDAARVLEVPNIYRYTNPRDLVFLEDSIKRVQAITAPHETQLVDPFGDGSVPQKPGFDHIVEFLDERVNTLLFRAPIQQGASSVENFIISRIVDPKDKVFTSQEEDKTIGKQFNTNANTPSKDIFYTTTARNSAATNPLLNFVKFTLIGKLKQDKVSSSDSIASISKVTDIQQDRLRTLDTATWLFGKQLNINAISSAGTTNKNIVYAQSVPGKFKLILKQSHKPVQDNLKTLDSILSAKSHLLSDKIYQEDDAPWLFNKFARHATQLVDPFGDGRVAQKPGLDFIVAVQAERAADPLFNFVKLGATLGLKSEDAFVKEDALVFSDVLLNTDRINFVSSQKKTIANSHRVLEVNPHNPLLSIQGIRDETQEEVGITVRRYPQTRPHPGVPAAPRHTLGFVDLGPGKNPLSEVELTDKLPQLSSATKTFKDRLHFEEVRKEKYFINKDLPVEFITDFQQSGVSARTPGAPKIKSHTSFNQVTDSYYERAWNTFYKHQLKQTQGGYWNSSGVWVPPVYQPTYPNISSMYGAGHWIDGTNTFPTLPNRELAWFQADSGRREDYALVADAEYSLEGDFYSFMGGGYKTRYRYWTNPFQTWFSGPYSYFPTKDAQGKRVLFYREFTNRDLNDSRAPRYLINSQGVKYQSGYNKGRLRYSGITVFQKLARLGLLGGTFQKRRSLTPFLSNNAGIKVTPPLISSSGNTSVQTDRVGAFFYPYLQNPVGTPEDVILKETRGPIKSFLRAGYVGPVNDALGNYLYDVKLETISKHFSNYHRKTFLNPFDNQYIEGLFGGAESSFAEKSILTNISYALPRFPLDTGFVRSRRSGADGTSDVKMTPNRVQKDDILLSYIGPIHDALGNYLYDVKLETVGKNFKNSSRKLIINQVQQLIEGIEGAPNETLNFQDFPLVISGSSPIVSDRFYIGNEKVSKARETYINDGEVSLYEIIPDFDSSGALINLNKEAPSSLYQLRRWGKNLYASESILVNRRTDVGGYTYTAYNTYTPNNVLESWQRPGYGPGTSTLGSFNYSTGFFWKGSYLAHDGSTLSTPYYYNSATKTAFLWNSVAGYWVLVTDIDISISNILGSYGQNGFIQPLTNRTDPTRPSAGNFTYEDTVNGGLINDYILYPPYNIPSGLQSEFRWRDLGNIEAIYAGDINYNITYPGGGPGYASNPRLKLLKGSNDHLYVILYYGSGVLTSGNISNSQVGNGSGTSWQQASYLTLVEKQTPVPGETLSPIFIASENSATDNTFVQQLRHFDRTHTETVEVADPGSAFIPVYCASYFLEPYVSEDGKSASF